MHQGQQWILAVANAGIAALLLFAATAKLASPSSLGQTLRVLTGVAASGRSSVVRVIGGTEAVVAVCLTLPVLRVLSALAVAWLWQRRAWGYILAGAFVVYGVIEAISVATDQTFGHIHDASQSAAAVPIFVVLALIALVPAVVYLRNLR